MIRGKFSKPTELKRKSDGKKVVMPKGTSYEMEMAPLGQPIRVVVNGVEYFKIIK